MGNKQEESVFLQKRRFAKKAFRSFALGGVAASLGVALETSVDALIVGNAYGTNGLAVTSVVMPLYMFFNLLSVALGVGGAQAVSDALAQEDGERAQRAYAACMWAALLAGLPIMLLGLFFAPTLTAFLGGGALGMDCIWYVRCIAVCAPLFLLVPVQGMMLRADAAPFLSALGTGVSVAVNLLLDLVFVTWLRMGIWGAALAMVIGQAAALLVFSTHFIVKKARALRWPFGRTGSPRGSLRLFADGVGTASYYAWQFLLLLVFNRILGVRYAEDGMAVFNIVFNVGMLSYAVFDGLSTALPVLLGAYRGERDTESTAYTVRLALRTAALCAAALALGIGLFPETIVRFFGVGGGAVGNFAARAVRLYVPAVLPACLLAVLNTHYQCLGKRAAPFLTSMARGLLLPLLLILPCLRAWGLPGTAVCLSLAECLTLMALLAYAGMEKRKGAYTDLLLLEKEGEAVLAAANAFEACMENDFSRLGEMMEAVEAFCAEKQIDKRSAYAIQLTIEELCSNIVRFGFEDGKPHALHVKLAVYDGDIFVRIRDDARGYNPFEKADARGDEVDSMALEMIRARAKSFLYQRRLVFNNLLIVL